MKLRSLATIIAPVAALALIVSACGGDDDADAAGSGPDGAEAAVTLPGGSLSSAFLASDGQASGISVSATGVVSADPDTAVLSLGVSALRDTVRDARDDAADAMNDLLGSVRGNGVDDDDIRTTSFNISPEYDYSRDERRIVGYRVTNQVSVTVRDIDRVADVIDEAVDAVGDVIQINGISFTAEDSDALLSDAREAAMVGAQAKAQELADLAGVTLGTPVAIAETSSGGVPPVFYGARAFDVAEAATPIEAGQLDVSVTVQVTYAID
jgi:uncharacterized protein YggE